MMYPHTVTLQTFTSVNDGMGGHTETWADIKTIQAHVQPIGGTEYYQAQQLQNPVEMDVFAPYDAYIKPSMRLVYDGQVLSIKAVLDQGGINEILLLKCSIANVQG